MSKRRIIMSMHRYWALLVSLLVAVSTFSGVPERITAEDFGFTQIIRQNYVNHKHGLDTVRHADRIVSCILKRGEQYAPIKYISVSDFQKIMFRTARRESRFKPTAYNSGTKARGLFQHLDRFWNHLIYYIDGGKLGAYVCKNNVTNTTKYYYRIDYSAEMGAIALSSFIISYRGNVRRAMSNYGGFTIENACPKKAKAYIDYIVRIK